MTSSGEIVNNFIYVYCIIGASVTVKRNGQDIEQINLNHIESHYNGQDIIIEGDNDYRYTIRDIDKRTVTELDDYLLIHNKDVDIYIEDFI